jgi:Putative collagen-binding domain of a collagenase
VAGAGSGDSQITASITSTGSHLIAYVPPTGTETRTFSVDLRSMAGNARARWWNPTTGTYLGIGANTYAFSNTLAAQSFTTSGDNGTGTNDWILLLDTAAGGTTGIPAVPALQCSPAAVVFAASILGLAGHAARRRAARG